jgi:diguanylate cyclase (GGDEF)-like protein
MGEHMMKVLQKKLLVLVICSTMISALVVMAISFSNYGRIVENNSGQIMQLMCSEKRQSIDEKLLNIEQSVHSIYYFATEQYSNIDSLWKNEEYYFEHISRMKELMLPTVKYTDGAVSVYYRLDSAILGPKQGVWFVQDENGNYIEQEMTDFSLYDKDDIEHVGWYYIPIDNGKETWINPYYNENMDEEIISYVIPIVIDGKNIGVVGMDIATNLLYENTKNVKVYNTGYAFLMDNVGDFVYHPEMKGNTISKEFNIQHTYLYEKSLLSVENQSVESYCWNDTNKRLIAQKLRNGMIFTVCFAEQEIKQPQQKTLIDSVLVISLILTGFVSLTVFLTKAIVRLIYTDAMTQVGNKAAYNECVDLLYKRIREKEHVNFLVALVDINDLKKVNDTYGHEYGDKLIQNGAAILKKVWGSENTYRVGGDEFVIVCSDVEKECTEKQISLFEEEIKEYNCQNTCEELYLQMAIGMAVYNSKTDKEYMDVFRRADSAMYEDKKQKKLKI